MIYQWIYQMIKAAIFNQQEKYFMNKTKSFNCDQIMNQVDFMNSYFVVL